MKRSRLFVPAMCVAFVLGFAVRGLVQPAPVQAAAAANRVFELRTYTAPPGKLEALKTRFRDHTIRIFKRYNMEAIGYWIPQDPPLHDNTLIYVLMHPSREEATKNWAAFQADPEWQRVRAESIKDGPITTKTPDSVFMDPADFSPIK
jgi:NIPSNAP protein